MYCEISLVVKALHCTRAFGTRAIRALTTRDISQYALDNVFIICQCACTYSSNHSYVSMNMDSVNDCELFRSLLLSDIYRSFFDDRVYESTAPLLELPISPSTNFLAESSPWPQNDPWHSDSTVAAPPSPQTITRIVLCSLLNTSCSFNLYVTWHNNIIVNMCICIISTLRWCAITLCDNPVRYGKISP